MKLALITIGQSPRSDLNAEMRVLLPADAEVIECGALDELDEDGIAELAPQPGEAVLTSRLRGGGSAVFAHRHAVPLVEAAIARAEAAGADASLLLCSGDFPALRHRRPLFLTERLAHDAVRGLLSGMSEGRLGVVRPLADQVEEGADQWEASIGVCPSAVSAASPYTAGVDEIAAAAADVAGVSDLIVLDCIGFGEDARAAAHAATGKPVVTVRALAARVLGAML